VVINLHNGKIYEINRFYPHNGADLKGAQINENSILICPRHGWHFDLTDGGRCQSAEGTLLAKKLESTITLCEPMGACLAKFNSD
jgi:UDP-MurNAc hydroxylase